eukprot:g21501.t1
MLRTLAILSFGLRSVTAFTCNASESCMNDENMKECQEMQAICGDLMIIMESCPLQFACPSCVCGEAGGHVCSCFEKLFVERALQI